MRILLALQGPPSPSTQNSLQHQSSETRQKGEIILIRLFKTILFLLTPISQGKGKRKKDKGKLMSQLSKEHICKEN